MIGEATPLLTVNYGYTKYYTTETDGNVQNAASLAADWVEYCNSLNDGSNPNGGTNWAALRASQGMSNPLNIKYWEIGNENYGNWEVGYEPDGADYAANWNMIYDAMKAVDSTIYIGLVLPDEDWWNSNWAADVMSYSYNANTTTGDRADFLIVHDYFHTDPQTQNVLQAASQIKENTDFLNNLVSQNTHKNPGDIPYIMSEYNTSLHNSEATPNQLVGGLFITKVLGEMIIHGWAAANYWDIANGWSGSGDHGFITKGHDGIPDFIPYPSYYPFYFYTRNFGDELISSTSSDFDVLVYASKFSSGEIGLIVINESAHNKTATIDLNGFTTSGDINAWILTGDQLSSTEITVNGISNGYQYGGPAIESVTPYFWNVGSASSITVNLKKYSVTSIMIY
jgi:alpha-L-arabinofuranosidase